MRFCHRSTARASPSPRLAPGRVIAAAGCTTYVGTTAKSFLGHVRNNPDPNVRYVAYSKLGSTDAYDPTEQKREAVRHPDREVRARERAGGQPGHDLPDAGRAARPEAATTCSSRRSAAPRP